MGDSAPLKALALALATILTGSSQGPLDRTTLVIGVNDIYRIEGLEGGTEGGLARVRALRKELEKEFPEALLLHGGDFLFPSFSSRMYQGEQMVSVLNLLDGDAAAFDSRMFVTLGNHEFDRGKLADAPMLRSRMEGSQFRWLNGNISFAAGQDGKPLVASGNLLRTAGLGIAPLIDGRICQGEPGTPCRIPEPLR